MRLSLAQINPTVGDVAANAVLVEEAIRAAAAADADLVVLPELCICGYPPKDLLLREGFVEACADAASRAGGNAPRGITVVIGVPLFALSEGEGSLVGRITNSLVAWRDGEQVGRYDKRLLPTYDVFDEDRYFEPGTRPCVIDVPTREGTSIRVGLAICEDLWKGRDAGFSSRYADAADPVEDARKAGAQVIVVPSASPFVLHKGERHREILRSHAARHRVFVASVNQVGGNDDLIFDGHAAVYSPQGALIAAGQGFRSDVLTTDISIGDVAGTSREITDPLTGAAPEKLLFEALVLGIRDYCRKTGFTSALLGLSGGIDSALTAVLAACALGPQNVLGISMPGPYSSEHSRTDARTLAANLGMTMLTIPIAPAMAGFRSSLDTAFESQGCSRLGASLPDLTEENLQSRIRGTILMAESNRTGAIVLTTGNKSEMAVGYATLYGDMNGGLAVLSDVTKQRVYALSRWINAHPVESGLGMTPIPESTIDKPPSAELRPDQTDQDTLPPYEILDRIIEGFIENHQSSAGIARETGIDEALVRKITRMIDLAEYKRKQAAVGLKVTTVAFGAGRRFPIAQRWRGG